MAFSIFNKSGSADSKAPTTDTTKTTVKSPVNDPSTKSGNDPKTGFPPTASVVSRPGGNPTATTVARPGSTGGTPEMMAYEVEDLPLLQEIAILYAAEQLDPAQELLRKIVADKNGTPQAWLMLLDLYKSRGLKKEFEDLAMTYTVKFERSPPTWNEQVNQPEARKEARPTSDFFSFQAKDGLQADISKLIEFANRLGSVRIDVVKIKTINPEEAGALAKALVDFRKKQLPVRFNNVNQIIDLLKKTIAENPSKEFANIWVLLFELYQRQGMQSEFEDLGLEYAMGFEMSPPSWEAVPLQSAGTDSEPVNEPDPPADLQGFPLRGIISLENTTQLQQLMNHASAHKEVHVNMAGLQRIDFSAAGIFVDALNKLATAGKKIVLVDVGELIFPMLEAFGTNRIAVLLRRKAQ